PPAGEDLRAVIRMKVVADRSTLHVLERLPHIGQHVVVGVFESTVRSHEGDDSRQAVDDRMETLRTRTQGFLIPPPILNVRIDSTPFDDLPGGVGHRTSTEEELAIRPIDTPQACCHFTRLANSHRGAPAFTHTWRV